MRSYLVLLGASLAALSQAQFFSVENTGSNLVRIEMDGSSSVVGSLGITATDTDLEWHQGTLYLLNASQGQVDLYTINTSTGAATFASTVLTPSSTNIQYAEGLASDGTTLHIAVYDNPGWSRIFATLDPNTGATTNLFDDGYDMDATTYDGTNFYALDVTGTGSYTMYKGTDRPSTNFGSDSGAAIGNVNSIDYAYGSLWGLSAQGNLLELSTVNADVLNVTTVSNDSLRYGGIAAVPEPATTLLALGLLPFLRKRKKQAQ